MLETLRALLLPGAPLQAPPATLPMPARVGAVIERRLARLSKTALQLARVVALAGQHFSLALAAHLTERPLPARGDPWRELEAAQVLDASGFAHDLVLEATRRTVPAPIARALHGRIAEFLTGREGAASAQAMLRNEELHLGLVRRHQGDFVSAVDLLERAVAHWRSQGPPGRAVLAENELAQLWLDLGQPARAQVALHTPLDGLPDWVCAARLTLAVRVQAAVDGRPAPTQRAAHAAGDLALAPQAHTFALGWLHAALDRTPTAIVGSLRDRQPVNRSLLATRLPGQQPLAAGLSG